jgi:hypothetical protein
LQWKKNISVVDIGTSGERNVFKNGARNTVKYKIPIIEIQTMRNTKKKELPEIIGAI